MAAIKKGCAVILLVICLERTAVGRTKLDLVTSIMNQNGSGGRQVFDGSGDQNGQVYEPMLFVESQVTRNTQVFGKFLADLWSSASEAIFDTNTGASGRAVAGPDRKLKRRIAFDLGVAQKIKTWTLTPRVGYSYEFDYQSLNGGLRVDKAFAQDNFILSLDYQAYIDKIRPFDIATAGFTPWEPKRVHTAGVSGSQILTPSDLILVGYSFTHQSGFLASNQNSVELSGGRVSEVLPRERLRHAVNLRYLHGFTDSLAAHADYRFYFDDWGILAHTLEPSLYWGFNEEAGLVKFFYRFYLQGASDYYRDSFAAQLRFMTSDSDLAAYHAHEVGAMMAYQWDFRGLLKEVTVSGTGLYYHRSRDGLNFQIFQLGLGGAF